MSSTAPLLTPFAPQTDSSIDRLIIVDLGSSSAAAPSLRRSANRLLRSIRGSAQASAAVLVQGGGSSDFPERGDTRVLQPADLLRTEEIAEIWSFMEDTTAKLVHGEGHDLFPTVDGVHLGELNLVTVQMFVHSFATLARASATLLEQNDVRRVDVFVNDETRGAAIEEMARALGVSDVHTWVPVLARVIRPLGRALLRWRERREVRALRRDATVNAPFSNLDVDTTSRVLIMSESTPIAQMFAAVEPQLAKSSYGPMVQVQLGPQPRSVRRNGALSVVNLGRPLVVPAMRKGRFRDAWRRARAIAHESLGVKGQLGRVQVRIPLEQLLDLAFLQLFDQQVEQLEYAQRILDETRPSLVVVGNDRWWVGQSFVQRARVMGIPSLCVQDGLAADNAHWWWITTDHWAACGDAIPRQMQAHGVPAERFHVTGQPRYDALCALRRNADATALRTKYDLPQGARCVLLATQPHQSPAFVQRIADAVLATPDVELLLRQHPAEEEQKYVAMARELGERCHLLGSSGNIFELIAASDALVTEFSTVALEAVILGKPVVTANFGDVPTIVSFAELGIAVPARDERELTRAVTRVLATGAVEPKAERAVIDLIGPLDGQSSARVARLIESLTADAESRRERGERVS